MKKHTDDINEIKEFARSLGHSYNNCIFKINAFTEIFNLFIDSDPEKVKKFIDKLSNASTEIEEYTKQLSHFAHTGEIEKEDN